MAIIRSANESMFQIRIGELDEAELRILRLSAEEGISELFRIDLELVSENPNLDFDAVVGQPAAIAIAGAEAERYLNGIVSRLEQGAIGERFTKYFAQIVPRVWTLLHRVDTRMFQDMSVPDIISQVLEDAGIPSNAHRSALKASYTPREYCVQYQESDWAFVSRLMEEEGIFYFFEHSEGDHVLVFGDDPSAHAPIEGEASVIFHDPTGFLPEQEYVGFFRYSQTVRTGAYSLRDYNFTRPNTSLDVRDQAEVNPEYEAFEYPGRYQAGDHGSRLAKVRLQEQQSLRLVGMGQSVCTRFTPGYRFTLAEHPREDFNREFLITDVQHEAYEPQALEQDMPEPGTETEYTNEFRCIPADVSYRPLRITPRPYIRGTQTAVVVGPAGEEIYTDPYGRIKVQFFWDRRSAADESSSCWMRVGQSWAGGAWGASYIPRVGQEVLVTFLDGDPDRPCVIGGLYNDDQMPPYPLPDQKTKSTLKSASSPGAEGFNEIRFEDKQGEEQIFIHAQKDLDLRVGEDRVEFIGKDAHLIVKENSVQNIEVGRHTKITEDDVVEVGKDHHLKVVGKEAIEIGDSHSLKVKGDVIEVFQSNHSEEVTQNYYLKGMGIVIESTTGITLKCGGSNVVIDPSGVSLKGAMVTVDGSMVKIASGPGSPPSSGSAGNLVSPMAPKESFEADQADPGAVAEARARQLETGKGRYGTARAVPFRRQEGEEEGEERTWIEIELVDEDGNPVPGERYEVTLPDGEQVASGTLDSNGFARIDGIDPGECQVTFPDLDGAAWESG